MNTRIVITGLGILCAGGNDLSSFSKNVVMGNSCLSKIVDRSIPDSPSRYAGLITEYPLKHLNVHNRPGFSKKIRYKTYDPYIILALEAAFQTIDDAHISPELLGEKMGLFLATCSGPMHSIEQYYEQKIEGTPIQSEQNLFNRRYSSCAKALTHHFKIQGLSTTITTACSSSTAALGIAFDLIQEGVLTAALVGGTDSFSVSTFAGFEGLKATCTSKCAPFSNPNGMNLGEGSGFCVVEDYSYAQKRGAKIYGEVLGYGVSNDAYHSSAPDPTGRGQALAMNRAMQHAQTEIRDISYINAHGTGTTANDIAETKAIHRVFGNEAPRIPISSTKSIVGHCLGAAGIIEIIASMVSADQGVLPPTAGFKETRKGCNLDYIPDSGRPWTGNRLFMKNSFAFGGNNVSILIKHKHSLQKYGIKPIQGPLDAICISGIGVVCGAGYGVADLISAMDKNEQIKDHYQFGNGHNYTAARVPKPQDKTRIRRLNIPSNDLISQFSTIASDLAIQESHYPKRKKTLSQLGLCLGLSSGSTSTEAEHISALIRDKNHTNRIQNFPTIVPNAVAGSVCQALNIQGYNTVLCAGYHAGIMGVSMAASAIKAGHTHAALGGGADELLPDSSSLLYAPCEQTELVGVPSEGAVFFLLEKHSSMLARGVKPMARLVTMAFSSDIDDERLPNKGTQNIEKTIKRSLAQSHLSKHDIGCICCQKSNRALFQLLQNLFYLDEVNYLDVAPIIGFSESCTSLMSMVYGLYHSQLGNQGNKNYILSVFSSQEGFNSVVILKNDKES